MNRVSLLGPWCGRWHDDYKWCSLQVLLSYGKGEVMSRLEKDGKLKLEDCSGADCLMLDMFLSFQLLPFVNTAWPMARRTAWPLTTRAGCSAHLSLRIGGWQQRFPTGSRVVAAALLFQSFCNLYCGFGHIFVSCWLSANVATRGASCTRCGSRAAC